MSIKEDIKEKYSEYVVLDPVTGIIEIKTATGILLPADTALEMVEFVGIAKSKRTTIKSTTLFYFHSNSWNDQEAYDSLEADVTLALTDVNSISFFANWGASLK